MDIIEMARELGREIQKDERYLAFYKAAEESEKDTELQDLIGQFNLKRVQINQEVVKEEKDTEKLEQLDKEMKEVYQKIMENTNMINFTVTKKEVDDLIGYISRIIALSASGENPDTIEKEDASCSGSCDSCGGCH